MKKIGTILEFVKSQGGHIGFKEIVVNNIGTKFTNFSIFSDGTVEYTNVYGMLRSRNYKYNLSEFSAITFDDILRLIQENKFL